MYIGHVTSWHVDAVLLPVDCHWHSQQESPAAMVRVASAVLIGTTMLLLKIHVDAALLMLCCSACSAAAAAGDDNGDGDGDD